MTQDAALAGSSSDGPAATGHRGLARLADFVPRGNILDDAEWSRRHRILQWVLLLHVPVLAGLGIVLGYPLLNIVASLAGPLAFLALGHVVRQRRWASFFISGGLIFCSITLVLLTTGSIEAHFHFFIVIGFIALYQDWVPFLWNVAFTVLSHGIGTVWLGGELIFNHPAAQSNPWLWSFIHGVAVLAACLGVVIFWRVTEEEHVVRKALSLQLVTAGAEAEIGRRQFTADLLVNLARRNQSMIYRQLDIINQLEDKERDPDALSDLFRLDHLATRVRRNAESLLVLAGEPAPRTWKASVPLRDMVRAAIAETEDLDRVVFVVDERAAVSGSAVADLTHLLAELTENAVRFSPPETAVTIRTRPNRRDEGGQVLTVEDWGVGMPPDDLAAANDLLANPREVDMSASKRLGFHVVARLAARHSIAVSLTATPGSGITAVVVLPAALFTAQGDPGSTPADEPGRVDVAAAPAEPPVAALPAASGGGFGPTGSSGRWRGWWDPEVHGADDGGAPETSGEGGAGGPGSGTNGHATNGPATNGPATNGSGGGAAPTVRTPDAEGGTTDAPDDRPRPSPRPAPAPSPRVPEARQEWSLPGGPTLRSPSSDDAGRPATTGRGLRRRVPQANLAPELRHQIDGLADTGGPMAPMAPLSSDAAATALSRYQASRQAAQSMVETPDRSAASEGGKRP